MADELAELARRLDTILRGIESMQEDVDRLGERLTVMQVADADARADAKVVAGELRVAATALANTAQSIQQSELSRALAHEANAAKEEVKATWRKDPVGIALIVLVGILGVIALGEKGPDIVAKIAAAFGFGS